MMKKNINLKSLLNIINIKIGSLLIEEVWENGSQEYQECINRQIEKKKVELKEIEYDRESSYYSING